MEEKGAVLEDLINTSYKEQKRYLVSMSDEARSAEGKVDDWSPKDVLAHIAFWDANVAKDLAEAESRQPSDGEDYLKINDRVWEQHKDSPWADIEAIVDETHDKLLNNLRKLDEEALVDPDRFEWLRGRALWRGVAFTSYYHALQHVAVLYADQGDLEYANHIQEQAAEEQKRLSNSDDWLGTVRYNLGCHYAITGQRDKALAQVKAGFELYPTLKKWAPDDPDLELIHDDEQFKALIGGE